MTGLLHRPARWLALLGGPLAVAGALGFGLGVGARAGWSFVAGFLIALATVSLGVLLVVVAGQLAPSLAMLAAVANYVLTTLLFLLLLVTVSPSLADVRAFACGLAVSVVPYVAWQVERARPRQ